MKEDFSPPFLKIEVPEHCQPAFSLIDRFVKEYQPHHVVCMGKYYPWAFCFLESKNGGRIDAIYQTKEMTDGDMVVALDVLQTNTARNNVRRSMNLPLTDLEIHVRDRSDRIELDSKVHRYGRPDCLFMSPNTQGSLDHVINTIEDVNFEFNYLILLTPQNQDNDVDNPLDKVLDDIDLLGYQSLIHIDPRPDAFGVTIFTPRSKNYRND